MKLLEGRRAAEVLEIIAAENFLAPFVEHPLDVAAFRALSDVEASAGRPVTPLLGLVALLGVDAAAFADVASSLKLSRRARARGLAAVVMLSTFGALNGAMMTGPRIFFAMADRGLFFPTLARVSPRFQSPSVAIWLAVGLGVVYVIFNDFAQLADKFVLGIWPFYTLAVAAVFVLRRRRPDLERPYKVWGYPVVPLLFLVSSVGMVVNALVTRPVDTGITFGIILLGLPVYWAWRRLRPA